MRDLSHAERALVLKGLCPGCHRDTLREGPAGGLSVNWYCTNPLCEGRYNLAMLPDNKGATFLMLAEVIQESKLPRLNTGMGGEIPVLPARRRVLRRFWRRG